MPLPLRISRLVQATPDRVFAAWTSPDLMRRWLFASEDGELVRVESSPVVGGRYTILEHRDDLEIDHFGRYLVVEPPHRLSFTLDVPEHFAESTRVDVTLQPRDDGCVLTFQQTGIDPEETRPFWEAMLDQLARTLAEGPT